MFFRILQCPYLFWVLKIILLFEGSIDGSTVMYRVVEWIVEKTKKCSLLSLDSADFFCKFSMIHAEFRKMLPYKIR